MSSSVAESAMQGTTALHPEEPGQAGGRRDPEPMYVKGRCKWQGRDDEDFVLRTVFLTEGPQLLLPSPLQRAPHNRGAGIFSNGGAYLSPARVRDFRDQLTGWLREYGGDGEAMPSLARLFGDRL